MKVLHYIASTGMGRGEFYIDLVNELCKSIDIVLLIPKKSFYKERINRKIKVLEYSSYDSRINPLLLMEVFWKIKCENPDIVHTHFTKASQIFYFLNKFLHIPHIATKHNSRKGKIFNKITYVTAVSNGVKETIQNKNIQVIYNGIQPIDVNTIDSDERFVILAVGRLDKIKGYDLLIRECAKLDFPFVLKIVGEGAEREKLEQLSQAMGISDNILFLGFRTDIPQLMSEANVVVMSSHSEGFSLVMVEALFYAKLFISTRVSGATEILEEKFLIDGFNIAAKLNEIYKNQHEFYRLFFHLKSQKKKDFELEDIAKKYIEYYQNTLRKN